MQIQSKETERGGGKFLIDGIIFNSLYCKMTKDNVSEDEEQTPSPEIILKPEYLHEIIIPLDFLPSVFSWHFSEGEGGFHEDTSCFHALKSQKQHDCLLSATIS